MALLSRSFVVNLLGLALAVVVAVTVIGLVSLWPQKRSLPRPPGLERPRTESATVVRVAEQRCRVPGQTGCRRVTIRLRSGPDKGRTAAFTFGDTGDRAAGIGVGDRVQVYRNRLPPGARLGGVRLDRYAFSDFERRAPLIWLTAIFAVLVLVTGRLRGAGALAGLAASLALVIFFVVPAIVHGKDPLAVAVFGSLAVMLVTIPLAHGLGVKTLAACLGTTAALLLTAGLADLFTGLAHLSGLSSDEAVFLGATSGTVSIRGLLLAGMVIGALGVLDDLTVTQASIVLALRRANPQLGAGRLFREALSVGHDHIAATVNTLVLAYAGAALPVLLVFNIAGTSFGDAVGTETVAEQVVSMLVGSIGLIAAVPITTALAAILATRVAPSRLAEAHAHAH